MNIINRNLTINVDNARRIAECIAGCRIELNPFEIGALANPFHPGFTLRCVLLGIDPGPDTVIFSYPRVKTFNNITDIISVDQVFTDVLSFNILNEDANGADEIRAQFTLVDNSNGQREIRRSNLVQLVL
jgi:hypothetical protein